ncbi:MAG: quinone-dependent dihydroorotate dehydrogenase [Epsilonproteobacteria bacterium]|nr:quinone-dependent dihydroorotate dehydrogenase [Campylobacterota bacterium]
MYDKIKPFLFKLDPEVAHNLAQIALSSARRCPLFFNFMIDKYFVDDKMLHQKIFGLRFLNPIGTAAGFDKDAKMIHALPALGFAWGELGAVTPKPQEGNAKPRVWRHISEQSLQNAFGFNNEGVDVIASRLDKIYPFILPLCMNIGKNKATPPQDAIDDYKILVTKLKNRVDFFTVNVSSPNTPNLRALLNEEFISTLFKELKSITTKPILIKLSPDMPLDLAVSVAKSAVDNGADGVIATNTTVDYSLVSNPQKVGGLSGRVLKEKSFKMFKALADELFAKTVLISVGGIDSAQEAYKRIRAGASLVQIFTAFIYHGPQLIKDINQQLLTLLKRDGFSHISEAIGVDVGKSMHKISTLHKKIQKRKHLKARLYKGYK